MDRLLENPGADLVGGVAPAGGALAVGVAEQADVDVARPADPALVDQLLDAPPLDREAQFEADREQLSRTLDRLDDAPAVRGRGRHRLLEQDVLAGLERGDRHLGVQVVGRHDVDHVERRVGDELPPVAQDAGLRMGSAAAAALAALAVQIAPSAAPRVRSMLRAWSLPKRPKPIRP